MNVFQKIFSLVLFGLILLSPAVVFAQSESKTNFDVPEYQGVDSSLTSFLCTPSDPPNGKDLETCINKGYRFGIAFGAISLVFFLVFAGYMYITGGEAGKEKGKSILKNALVGISLLLGSYLILSFINPSLVLFKPIQPPIFTAADMPSCEEVGFEEACVLPGGEIKSGSGSSGWGQRIPCPGNKLVSAKGLGLPTKAADEQICEDFGKKLLGLKTSLSGVEWRITDTIGSRHGSSCHAAGNNLSGTCADIGLIVKSTTNFNKVCKALIAIGDLQPVNETEDPSVTECGKLHDYGGTGPHLHVNWRKGSGDTTSKTGSSVNQNCISNPQVPGLCSNPLQNDKTWPDEDWSNTDPGLKTAYNQWVKLYKQNIPLKQVYRSPAYAAHLRSIWEASQFDLKTKYGNDISVKTFDPAGTCASRSSSFVTKSIYDKWTSEQLKVVRAEMSKHGFSSQTTSTTCASDHDKGIGLDVLKSWSPLKSDIKRLEQTAVQAGLCHNVKDDEPHFALKSKSGNANCYWNSGG